MYASVFLTAIPEDVKNNPVLLHYRELQLQGRNDSYPWAKHLVANLPSSFEDKFNLPTEEGFHSVKNVNFYGSGGFDAIDAATAVILPKGQTMSEYEKMAKLHPVPDVRVYELGRWTSDVEFGRQILNGVNPVVIRRCSSALKQFPVTEEMVKGLIDRGQTLKEAMEVCIPSTYKIYLLAT